VSVPLATSSGEWLEKRVEETPAVERHTRLADGLLPWSIALFVLLALWWAWHGLPILRRSSAGASPALERAVAIAGPLLIAIAAIGALIEVALIGHAGAVVVWQS
jgi:hypothetical protein